MNTIDQVAREAGVSVATVSRVMNGNVPVSPETAEKVKEAIKKLNYKPNEIGRNLRKRESRTILIFAPNISNPYYSAIVAGIDDMARRSDYHTMLCITDSDKDKEKSFLDLLKGGRADGAIFLNVERGGNSIEKLSKNYPVVQCCEYEENSQVSHVSIDNQLAGKQVVQYILSLNHRRIGYIGSTNQFTSTKQRESGYKEALSEADITPDDKYIAYADSDYNFLSGVRAAHELLCLKERPTAIFCISDVIALGAIRAAEEMGLSVPGDISVVGFDDVQYASMLRPMLTTVSQPGYSLGKISATILLNLMKGDKKHQEIFLEHKLIVRETTAKCRDI